MWKCSKCGSEFEGNFCGHCGGSRVENEAMQPTVEEGEPEESVNQQSMPEGEFHQQKISENAYQQPISEEEGGGKKGCMIAAIVIVVIIALIATVIYFAMSLIFGNVGDSAEDRRPETEVNVEIILDEEEAREGENEITEWPSPFNFDVWDSTEIVQIELNGIALEVPVPPNTIIEEEAGDCTALFVGEDDWEDWFVIQITLRRMMESDFEDYFAYESTLNLEWHNEWAEILDKQEFEERDVGLMITHWDVAWDDGFTFTKISRYKEAVLLTEIRFESVVGREELFEAFGFMDSFGEIIEPVLEDILWEETRTVRDHIGFDSPEEAVITFLEGLRVLDYLQMTRAVSNHDRIGGNNAGDEVVRFIDRLNWVIDAFQSSPFQIPVEPYEFQSLEVLGFVPPEDISERYLHWEEQGHMTSGAERAGVDRVVSRVAIFELGGEKLMFIVDVAKVDEKWKIFEFGGVLDVQLSMAGLTQGVTSLEFAKLRYLDDEFDLEAVMIPMD